MKWPSAFEDHPLSFFTVYFYPKDGQVVILFVYYELTMVQSFGDEKEFVEIICHVKCVYGHSVLFLLNNGYFLVNDHSLVLLR